MMPDDQARLRDVMRLPNLLDCFLHALESSSSEEWFQKNAALFLEVCTAHGQTAAQHHNQLVERFIKGPSSSLTQERLKNITASGPPLHVLLRALEDLRDLWTTAERDDIPSRYADLRRLRAASSDRERRPTVAAQIYPVLGPLEL